MWIDAKGAERERGELCGRRLHQLEALLLQAGYNTVHTAPQGVDASESRAGGFAEGQRWVRRWRETLMQGPGTPTGVLQRRREQLAVR